MQLEEQLRKAETEYVNKICKETGLNSTIENFYYILDGISMNIFRTPKIQSYLFNRLRTCPGIDASIKTLKGIKSLCLIKDIPDVYLLLRKLRDNLFLDLFLFESQKKFENVSSETFTENDLKDPESLFEKIQNYTKSCIEKEQNSPDLVAINKWKQSKLLKIPNHDENKKIFRFDKFIYYICENNKLYKECYEQFLEKSFENYNLIFNDFVHNNAESLLRNGGDYKTNILFIKKCLEDILEQFLVTLFFVDSNLFMSSDLIDALDAEMTPPENSQYFVMACIVEVFENIRNRDKKLFEFLMNNNINCMIFD